eukprot:CAMPEP_0204333936 /NCGR_PEP_ID=MMETSP0469-20131031/17627_1 /ASSEMBLY_ACC=CAM_ASM_000384 /TAXON_ID=2969 /ORGANISM="Oxyrrhis marina" /LENGTH=205 /DNA_ID=CAMNT_0051317371 /DNA_START=84 /DNA_END=701 /DNA_ORIENTATION=+
MKFCPGVSLGAFAKKQGPSSEGRARSISRQVLSGLEFTHRHSVVHRDIKLENLILNTQSRVVQIIDFGFAVQCSSRSEILKVFCGTPSYMSPAIVRGKGYSGFKGDVWAGAVVLYALLVGRFPFSAPSERELYNKIRRGVFSCTNTSLSEPVRSCLNTIFVPEDGARPDAEQVLAMDWFTRTSPDETFTGTCTNIRPSTAPSGPR